MNAANCEIDENKREKVKYALLKSLCFQFKSLIISRNEDFALSFTFQSISFLIIDLSRYQETDLSAKFQQMNHRQLSISTKKHMFSMTLLLNR